MGKPCRVTFGEKVFFKPDFVKRFLDTLHLDDDVVANSTYLKSIGYDNAFNEGDPMLIREKKAEAKAVKPILSKNIDVESNDGRKGLVPTSELEEFIGEDRLGEAQMATSRETIDRLKEDIAKNGFKEPIVIVYDKFSGEGEATIIEGNHRIIAAKELGLTEVPVTFEKGTIRDNESRVKDKMFPIKRKTVGKLNDTRGVKGADLGLTVRQPTEADFVEAPKSTPQATAEPSIDNVAQNAGVSPKNIRDLYKINRELFSLNQVKALASAVAMDRMIGVMAKRAGITKAEMYSRLKFEKASEQELPQGVKMQQDAWHGSPYEFSKFTTEKIGTGEGNQTFGWGLYFTDIEGIARSYAENLTGVSYSYDGKILSEDAIRYLDLSDKSNELDDFNQKTIRAIAKKAIARINKVYIPDFENIQKITSSERQREVTMPDKIKTAKNVIKELQDIIASKEIKLEKNKKIYKVTLHKGKTPDQYDWLVWDKPVSNEVKEKVKEELTKLGISTIRDGYTRTSYFNGEKVEEDIPTKDTLDDKFTGKQLYEFIALKFNGKLNEIQEQASLLLLRAGVDGNKVPADISSGATSETAKGFNYVVFDENAVSIEEVIKFQKDAEKARGAMMITLDGQATIYALTDPNVSTPLHELAHVFEHYLTDGEKKAVMNAAKTKEWNIKTSEYFARGFEKYLAEGKSPIAALDKIFAKFKEWLTDIYNGILGSDIDIELNDKMRKIYAQMLGKEIVNKPASKKAETKEQAKEEAQAKVITNDDVKLKRGEDFSMDGVYNVMYGDEVIGRIYYDRSSFNAWVDNDVPPGNKGSYSGYLGTKEEAIQKMVDRYNDKQATSTKQPTPTSKAEPTIFDDLDASNKRGGIRAQQEAKKAFAEKHGEDAAVAKAISTNFEAIADELKAKGIFTKIEC